MESMYLLIPVSVVLVFVIGLIFLWSVRSGQFDDMEAPGYRILMDDDKNQPVKEADQACAAGEAVSGAGAQEKRKSV